MIPASGISDTSQYRLVSYSPDTLMGSGPIPGPNTDTRRCLKSISRQSISCGFEAGTCPPTAPRNAVISNFVMNNIYYIYLFSSAVFAAWR